MALNQEVMGSNPSGGQLLFLTILQKVPLLFSTHLVVKRVFK